MSRPTGTSRSGRAVDPIEPSSTAARDDSALDAVTADLVDHPEEDRTGLTGAPDPHVDDEDQATTRDREVHRTLVAGRRRDPMGNNAVPRGLQIAAAWAWRVVALAAAG